MTSIGAFMNTTQVVVHFCPRCVKVRVAKEGDICIICENIARNRSRIAYDTRIARFIVLALVIVVFAVLGALIYFVTDVKPKKDGVGEPRSSRVVVAE